MQSDIEKRAVDFGAAVVVDEVKLLNLFMKKLTRERVVPVSGPSTSLPER